MAKIRTLPNFLHMKALKVILILLVISFLYAIFNATISMRFKYNEMIAISAGRQKILAGKTDSLQQSYSGENKNPAPYSRPRPNALYYAPEVPAPKDEMLPVLTQGESQLKLTESVNEESPKSSATSPTKSTLPLRKAPTDIQQFSESSKNNMVVVTVEKTGSKDHFQAKQILEGRNATDGELLSPLSPSVLEDEEAQYYVNEMPDINRWWLVDNSTAPDCESEKPWELKRWKKPSMNESQLWPGSCEEFKEFWSYPERPMSQEEENFPLAYVFMSHRNLHQTLRLFRAIYNPQNVYCINWDQKSAGIYKETMEKMTSCFDNVIKPKQQRNIYWCHNSILKATMDCMDLLHKSKRPWKYVQIVSWNDFPLKTNLELVQIYKRLNGSIDSDLEHPRLTRIILDPSNKINPVPPGGLVLYKGTYAATMPRSFVSFVFEHPTAQKFFHWLDSTRCGEEFFWATLAHNRFLKAPGHFPGSCIDTYDHLKTPKPFISRYQLWEPIPEDYKLCKGKMVLYSCVFGLENVAGLKFQPHLMGHKFYEEVEPSALYCMEKWHYEKTYNHSRLAKSQLDYYSNLQAVKFHNLDEKEKENYRCSDKFEKWFKNFGKL